MKKRDVTDHVMSFERFVESYGDYSHSIPGPNGESELGGPSHRPGGKDSRDDLILKINDRMTDYHQETDPYKKDKMKRDILRMMDYLRDIGGKHSTSIGVDDIIPSTE